jgi:hypothetical protein
MFVICIVNAQDLDQGKWSHRIQIRVKDSNEFDTGIGTRHSHRGIQRPAKIGRRIPPAPVVGQTSARKRRWRSSKPAGQLLRCHGHVVGEGNRKPGASQPWSFQRRKMGMHFIVHFYNSAFLILNITTTESAKSGVKTKVSNNVRSHEYSFLANGFVSASRELKKMGCLPSPPPPSSMGRARGR